MFFSRPLRDQAQALKQTIVEKAAGTSNGLEATDDQRDVIAEAINELVALNPTEDITTSGVATGELNFRVFKARQDTSNTLRTIIPISQALIRTRAGKYSFSLSS